MKIWETAKARDNLLRAEWYARQMESMLDSPNYYIWWRLWVQEIEDAERHDYREVEAYVRDYV